MWPRLRSFPSCWSSANNQYAYSTPNDRQFACQDLLDKAVGYGVAGHRVEATDLGRLPESGRVLPSRRRAAEAVRSS